MKRIILLESNIKDADKIEACMNTLGKPYNIKSQYIPGVHNTTYQGTPYHFYNETILETLSRIHEESSDSIGLLLGMYLTKEGLDSNLFWYYPQPDLAKKIFFRFYKEMPIYLLAASPTFGNQSEQIMGIDLTEQFITKDILLTYQDMEWISKMFAFYQNFVRKG